jgi:hypothetical protein
MRVSPLAAGAIEDAGSGRETEHVDESRDLEPIPREIEERLVFLQVAIVEIRGPPL